jgi:hypothetical protein
MATVGLVLTAVQQTPPAPAQSGAGPQANAAPSEGTAQQQDIVTLAGRAAESQQSRAGDGNSQFGEAAAFFYAEQQTFRAANGSASSPQLPSTVPDLPVKTTDQVAPGGTQAAETHENADQSAGSASLASEPTAGAVAGGSSAPTSAQSGASQTPMAELAQLDVTLQQMGINPQSITLFNRMAMLLYANDPAALRVLIQTLQTGTQQLATTSNQTATNDSANAASAGPAVQRLLSSQTQSAASGAPAQLQDGANNGQIQAAAGQASADTAAVERSETNQGTSSGSAAGAIVTNTTGSQATSQPEAQTGSFAIQLEGLQFTFAAVGANQASGQQNSPSGQVLDVTA